MATEDQAPAPAPTERMNRLTGRAVACILAVVVAMGLCSLQKNVVRSRRGGREETRKEEETPPGGSGTAKPRATTTIIVLGQSLNPDRLAPATLRSRVRTTAALVASAARRDAGCLLVLCSGDPATTGVAESEAMRRLLNAEFTRLAITPPTTVLDLWPRNTVGNALHVARLLES